MLTVYIPCWYCSVFLALPISGISLIWFHSSYFIYFNEEQSTTCLEKMINDIG